MGTILHELGFHPNLGSPSRVWDAHAARLLVNHLDDDASVHDGCTHVAVYRDPVDRFVNQANYIWCIEPSLYFRMRHEGGCDRYAAGARFHEQEQLSRHL